MAAPIPDVFEHRDPWTEAEFLALPVDRRFELLDGALLVSPSARQILIPDLAVVAVPGLDLTLCEAADVVLVVEIASPGNAAVDRAVKPQLYAQAGVPHYLRIELAAAGPRALVYRLDRDHYTEVACVDPGQPLVLTEPIAVTLDLAALATMTRSPG